MRAWSQCYRDEGLVVIGVHTPEFSFEHDIDLVRQATNDRAITTRSPSTTTTRSGAPSATTIGRRSTSSTRRRHHPRRALRRGADEQIARAPSSACSGSTVPSLPSKGVASRRRPTCTTCERRRPISAIRRGERFAAPDVVELDERHAFDVAGAPDAPTIGRCPAPGRSGGRRSSCTRPAAASPYRFDARDAHLVLSRGDGEPIPCPRPRRRRTSRPSRTAWMSTRLERPARRQPPLSARTPHDTVRERTLTITFLEPGAEAYSFTFG